MPKVEREVKKAEAIRWMNILGVNKDVVKLFEDHDIVMACSGTTGTYLPLAECLKPRSVNLNSSGMTLSIWSSVLHLLMDGWIRCCS